MSARAYMKLPINADEGFPQSFRLSFLGNTYQLWLYANIAEHLLDTEQSPDSLLHLPTEHAFLVLRVLRESETAPQVIFHRKLVPNLEYDAAELSLVFREMKVARGNLNGVGQFGSSIIGGVAARWAS